MMRQMPSSLFAKWMAFDQLEPISVADFMPQFDQPKVKPKPKTSKELYNGFRDWAILSGAETKQ